MTSEQSLFFDVLFFVPVGKQMQLAMDHVYTMYSRHQNKVDIPFCTDKIITKLILFPSLFCTFVPFSFILQKMVLVNAS